MTRIILSLSFAFWLAACGTIPNPVSRTELAAVEATYGSALALMVGYRNSCAQKLIPPSCRPIVAKLQAANVVAKAAIDNVHAFVKNNPTVNAGTLIAAAQDAVSAFRAVESQNGVN